MRDHLVAVLAYDRLCTFEFGCVVEMFALDRPELGIDWYRFAVCGLERGPLRATGGIRVLPTHSLATLSRADTIIVPGWRDADETPPAALLDRLRRAHDRGARLASICSGVFVLAAAGLLDGRRATTHWRYAQRLAARHPAISVDADALYVDEGQVLTSAGSAAGLDMMLHLVRRDHGATIANRVAQRLVMPPHRVGDQAQFVARPMPDDDTGRLSRLLDWLRARLDQPHSVTTMAERAGMSPRTMQRRFRETTGLTPLDWLVRERVALAKVLLETTPQPLARLPALTGFGADETFRRHFRRVTGVTPSAYRRQFGPAG